jgi:hypothetical protein
LLDLEKHLKKKAEWRKGVGEHVDLFATSLNHKMETFVSPVPDPLAFAVDAMSLSWDGMFAYSVKMKRFWPWMYHFSLELRQKISSERKS